MGPHSHITKGNVITIILHMYYENRTRGTQKYITAPIFIFSCCLPFTFVLRLVYFMVLLYA